VGSAHWAQALDLTERALAMRDAGTDASPWDAAVLRDQARALIGLHRLAEARPVFARAQAMREKAGIRPALALAEEAGIAVGLAAK
jgi:hypothetical protein